MAVNNNPKSQLELNILKYKQSKKLIRFAIVIISVFLVILLILLSAGYTLKDSQETTSKAVEAYKNYNFPQIGDNGNWWIDGKDTGVPAKGADGQVVLPQIGDNGNWWISDKDTGISAKGEKGDKGESGTAGANGSQGAPGATGATGERGADGKDGAKGADGQSPYIGENGNWWIGGKDTGVPAGTGPGKGEAPNPNAFTISMTSSLRSKGIALSETKSFANPTASLSCVGIANSWNITFPDIPTDVDSDMGGSKNGQYYLAYTFYLKNTGEVNVDYNYSVNLEKETLGALKAVRVGLFIDGKRTLYGAPAKSGGLEPAYCDEVFTGDTKLINKNVSNFQSKQVSRYTVLLWYEGNDPECIDEILGGGVRLSLDFNVKEQVLSGLIF